MASIRDVAKEAGVSPATVSRTFTSPSLLNEETQKRVLDAARRLNYQPPRLRPARISTPRRGAPRNGDAEFRSGDAVPRDAIGFQFFAANPGDPLFSNNFYAPVLAGAQAEASALGLHLLVHTTDRHQVAQELPRMVLEQAVGGLLLVGTAEPEVLARFAHRVPEIVLVDNLEAAGPFERVVSDGFDGALEATNYLISLGHRRIAFFLAEEGVDTFRERRRGWLCAMAEAGLPVDPALVVVGASTEERLERLAARLRSEDAPTALLAANDHFALMALNLCRELKIKVPTDLSVVGFDDIHMAEASFPALTTVKVDKEFMGRLAVRRLHARLHAEAERIVASPDPLPVRHQIPTHLVVRGSTGPPVLVR
jgi:Transcriptional regulators